MESKFGDLYLLMGVFYVFYLSGYRCDVNEKKLLKYLFDPKRENAHDILERPVQNFSDPVEVRIKAFLVQLIDLDEKKETFHTNMWLSMKWNDYHFQWNPESYGGITEINIHVERVWKPDLVLYNCANDKIEGFYPVNVQVKHNSFMTWFPPITPISTCSIDITWFPFDMQNCSLKYSSWTYSVKYLDLKLQCSDDDDNQSNEPCTENGMVDLTSFIPNGEFNIIDCPMKRSSNTYQNQTFIDLTFTIRLQRKYLYYIINLVAPCLLISALTTLVFIIPPDAGEKISLGVTVLLSMIMFLFLVADKLPHTSKTIPMISIYFMCIMIMCSLSVGFTVLVLNFHFGSLNSKPIPLIIKKLVNNWLAKLLFMTQNAETKREGKLSNDDIRFVYQPKEQEFSGIIDKNNKENSCIYLSNIEDGQQLVNEKLSEPWQNSRYELIMLINEVKKITQKLKDDESQIKIGIEWKFSAKVIDRFCLTIYIIFITASAVIVVSKIPNYENYLA